ncbi:MAG: hypothetical protein GY724_18895 [Actinomycetia bacterium]|nr:hypothetical protein [Actinomycetes bacterium]MCP5033759.1 hypothetical protein [Actinomycetes bacterium]
MPELILLCMSLGNPRTPPAVIAGAGVSLLEERVESGLGLETTAGIIGIEADDLKAALDNDQSLAEIAEANGVDPDALVDALIADAEARIDEKVEAGHSPRPRLTRSCPG